MARTINKPGLLSADMGQVCATMWQWWRKELLGLLPPGLRQWLRQDDRRLILRPQGNMLLLASAADPLHPLREIPLDAETPDARAIQESLRPLRFDTAAVQLPPGMVLKRTVSLPVSAKNSLHTILGYQMASLTPWPQEQVYFGWHLQDTAGPMLHLTLYVCPRHKADPIIRPLEQLGFPIHHLLSDEGLLIKGFFAAPAPEGWRHKMRSPLPWLGLLTLAALALTLWLPLHFLSQEVAILETMAENERSKALQAAAIQQQLERLRAETVFLAKQRSRQPPVFMVIEDLAEHLPLDAWVYMMRQSGSEVVIWGMATSAKDVLVAMKKSRYWQHATFEAPAVEDNARDKERFQLRTLLARSPGTAQDDPTHGNGLSNDALDEEGLEP